MNELYEAIIDWSETTIEYGNADPEYRVFENDARHRATENLELALNNVIDERIQKALAKLK